MTIRVRDIWDSVCIRKRNIVNPERNEERKEKYPNYPGPRRLCRARERVIERRDIKHERNKGEGNAGEEARERWVLQSAR